MKPKTLDPLTRICPRCGEDGARIFLFPDGKYYTLNCCGFALGKIPFKPSEQEKERLKWAGIDPDTIA